MKKFLLILPVFFLFACSGAKKSPAGTDQPVQTLEGSFRSIKGVMDNLSCYCYNGGYLTTEGGQRIALCFEEEQDVECQQIQVTGTFTEITIEPDANSPCPAGTRKVFKVQSFECK